MRVFRSSSDCLGLDRVSSVSPVLVLGSFGALAGSTIPDAAFLGAPIVSRPFFFSKSANIPFVTNTVGGMFGLFFSSERKITTYQQVTASNVERFKKFYHGMLQQGVYLAPSAYEAGFVSSAHTSEDVQATLLAAEKVFSSL